MLKIKPSKKKSNKPEIVAVGSDETGFLYLQKRFSLSLGETLEITKYEQSKKQSTGVLNTIIKSISKEKNISKESAAEYIFGKEVEGVKVFPPDQEAVIMEYEEELFELNKLQIPTLEISNFVATLMLSGFHIDGDFIPGRIAYQVELLKDLGINQTSIEIEPLGFELPDRTKIKFGEVVLTVNGNHDSETENIAIEKAPGSIASHSTGFLYDSATKQYILGSEGWSFSDTAQLPQELIQEVYNFYLAESGKLNDIQESKEEGGKLTPLEEVKVLEEKTSTGTKPTSESKNTKLQTPALVAG